MQIQYAVFCQEVDFSQNPPYLKQPISELATPDLSAFTNFGLPLFVTFVNGTSGIHSFHIDITWPTGDIRDLPDFHFNWPAEKASYGEVFMVKFQPDAFGLYTFCFKVDGQELREIALPILQEE